MLHLFTPRGPSLARPSLDAGAPDPKGTLAQQAEAWDRRRFLTGLGMGALFFTEPGLYAQTLVTTPRQALGPYYPPNLPLDVNNDLVILGDNLTPADGVVSYISGRVLDSSGSPVRNAVVEIWQADNNGAYIHPNSPILPRDANFQGFGEFLTDSQGQYLFRTVLPGFYPGRTRHVHVRVATLGGAELVTQLYVAGLPENDGDMLLRRVPAAQQSNVVVPWDLLPESPVGALWAQWDIVLDYVPDTSAPAEPVLPQPVVFADGAVLESAGFQREITSGSWISVFGTHFAEVSRGWDPDSEIVNGEFPTSLEGVSVTIDGKPAAVSYVSPTQINAQAPAGLSAGAVEVIVTTPNGSSAPIHATVADLRPEFFQFPEGNAAAVRPTGGLVGPEGLFSGLSTVPASSGETILMFGSGFGATTPSVAPGQVFEGAAPLDEDAVIEIGGTAAQVLFAGLSGAGLYQFNVVVPELPAGTHPVVARMGEVTSSGAISLVTA